MVPSSLRAISLYHLFHREKNHLSSRGFFQAMASSSPWTAEQNSQFENALAVHDEDTPDRWQKIAREVSGKSAEEVKLHYDNLIDDLLLIEAGRIPCPDLMKKLLEERMSEKNLFSHFLDFAETKKK